MNITKEMFEETLNDRNYWFKCLYKLDVLLGNNVDELINKDINFCDSAPLLMYDIYEDLMFDIIHAKNTYFRLWNDNEDILRRT